VRAQAKAVAVRHAAVGEGDELKELADAMAKALTEHEEKLHQYRSTSSQDVLNYRPGIDGQFLGLKGFVESALAKPTDASYERYDELRAQLDTLLAELEATMDEHLALFNEKAAALERPAVFPTKGLER